MNHAKTKNFMPHLRTFAREVDRRTWEADEWTISATRSWIDFNRRIAEKTRQADPAAYAKLSDEARLILEPHALPPGLARSEDAIIDEISSVIKDTAVQMRRDPEIRKLAQALASSDDVVMTIMNDGVGMTLVKWCDVFVWLMSWKAPIRSEADQEFLGAVLRLLKNRRMSVADLLAYASEQAEG